MTLVFGVESQQSKKICLQGDFVTPMESDFSAKPVFLFDLLENRKGAAAVAAARWVRERGQLVNLLKSQQI